jgi:hypothetical protein
VSNTATNLIDDLRLLEAPKPLAAGWWVLIGVTVLAVVGFVLWRRWRARRPQLTPAMVEAATEDALAELEKLRSLIAMENSRPYAIQVSGVVRRYIERRFGIFAPRRSTEEFLVEAQSSPLLADRYQEHLSEFLASCDFLKFARAFAETSELEQIHSAAVRFVADTQEPNAASRTAPVLGPSNGGRSSDGI